MAMDDIRRVAEWTKQVDERIMEFLYGSGSHPSSAIGHFINDVNGINYSRSYINQRCHELAEYGLLEKNYKNFALSPKGEAFLEDNIDLSKLEKDPNRS